MRLDSGQRELVVDGVVTINRAQGKRVAAASLTLMAREADHRAHARSVVPLGIVLGYCQLCGEPAPEQRGDPG